MVELKGTKTEANLKAAFAGRSENGETYQNELFKHKGTAGYA